jgi:hypothetical protein
MGDRPPGCGKWACAMRKCAVLNKATRARLMSSTRRERTRPPEKFSSIVYTSDSRPVVASCILYRYGPLYLQRHDSATHPRRWCLTRTF